MWIIGCDFHPRFQQIAFVNTEGGECGQRRLEHRGEAEEFYRSLAGQGVRVGMETGGSSRWFERLLSELGQELWIGDAAKIRAAETRKQKTDARDAEHLRQLLCSGQFEKMRIWIPPAENRDLRQLLRHRHRLVQMRTRVKNQLRSLASSEGMERKPGLWSQRGQQQFQALELAPWAGRRRQDNLELLTELLRRTDPLDEEVAQQAATRSAAADDSGMGPITALAFVLVIGDPARFPNSKKLASYLGLIPREDSSGGKQRLGHISKQGNAMLRGLLVEAAHVAVRHESQWKRDYRRLAMRKNRSIAVVAVARKLAVRLWWMWRRGVDYAQLSASGSHAG
jgi:transposase